jgi:uncharacterized protein (DUF779 family)
MVLRADEFPLGTNDVLVGRIEGIPVYVGARELDAWPHGDLELDLEPGYADGFSLAPADGLHFVSRSTSCADPRRGTAVAAPFTCADQHKARPASS